MMVDHVPQISVDGAATLRLAGKQVGLSRTERIVLAGLALEPGNGVDAAVLTRLRWPDEQPRTARQVLHNAISALRRKGDLEIVHDGGRYRLGHVVDTDASRLRAAADTTAPPSDGVFSTLTGAPSWFDELPDVWPVRAAAGRLDELLAAARQQAIATLEAADRPAEALILARQARLAHPGNDARWATEVGLLITLGRRLDAAATFRQACRTLQEDHGVGPGPRLRTIEGKLWSGGGRPAPLAAGPSTRLGLRSEIRRGLTGGETLVLTGSRWIGKTQLAMEVARDWPVPARIVGCGRSRRQPLAPLLEVAPGLPTGLVQHARQGLVGRGDWARLVHAALEDLDDTALVVLDDVDRLAPLSLRLLGAVLRQSGARVLATSRRALAAVPGRDDARTVQMSPLQDHEVAVLAQSDTRTGRTLRALTGGNPGLVALLVDAARRTGLPLEALARLPDVHALPAPVGDALHARLGPLDSVARGVVEDLALFGPKVLAVEEMEYVARHDPSLLRIRGDGAADLAHPLLRRAVLEHLPPGLRREVELLNGLGASAALPA